MHSDTVRPFGDQLHASEVAGDVRQQIGGGIADLIEDLLRDHGRRDEATGSRRLRDGEVAVEAALDDRVADVRPVGHRVPVGEETARSLTAAFDDVASETACGEPIVVVRRPAELVHQHAQGDGRVDAPTGDHHVGPRIQCRLDRQGTEVRIRRDDALGEWHAALQLAHGLLRLSQLRDEWHDVVTGDHGDLHVDPQFLGEGLKCRRAGLRVDAARIADHADPTLDDVLQDGAHGHGHEVGRVAERGVLLPRRGQDRHGQFGQIVEDQIVDLPAGNELRRTHAAVAPESRGSTNADGSLLRR